MPAICLEHPGRKTQECDDGIDYDALLAVKLGNMLGAYRCEAISPVEIPLLRGGDADHNTSSIFQAGTCLGSCECNNLYPKHNKEKHRMMSPVPEMDGKERAQLVGDVNLKTSRPKMVKQRSQKSLFKPLSKNDIDMILLDDVDQSAPDFSEISVPPEIRKPTLDEINAMYAEWVRDNHNATPIRTDTMEFTREETMYDPPTFAAYKKDQSYTFQAGTALQHPSTSGNTNSGTMMFSDTDANVINTVVGEMDDTRYLAANAADGLANFFSRPLLIQTITVAVGANTFVEFNPWKRFIDNKRVINRLTNYNNLRARMHVKFLINGNGFYYGKLIASYLPLKASDGLEHAHITPSPANICLATQRPHVFLDPCMSTAGQLDLPFFFWKDAMNIPALDWEQMGQIYVESINPLRNANGSTADVTITVFAWMSEVVVDSPTLVGAPNLIAQAGEYVESDIISRPATVLSNAATMISPLLGSLSPYAMAVANSAGMVANMAKAFGYSRPTSVEQPMKMTPRHIGNLANYDVMDMGTKLALDSKNEVTVDTRVMGLGGHEETSFTYLASISNYLRSTQWNSTQLTGTKLTTIRAWPCHRIAHGTLVGSVYPSYSLPTFDFAYWTGTFVLKIEVVCSSFHKGRLQIVYDPNNTDALPETNIQHTYIMDIADSKELIIEVPWSQSRTFLNTVPGWPSQNIADVGLDNTGSNVSANGMIAIYVLNELTVPSSTTLPVEINVYGSFKDDFKVMCPERSYANAVFRNLTTQAGQTDCAEDCQMPNDTSVEYSAGGDQRSSKQLAVYAGESITTFRALWKRPHLLYILPKNTVNNNLTTFVFPMRPKPRGTVPTFTNYNLTTNNGLTLTAYAYAGWRGSLRYKCITQSNKTQVSIYPSSWAGISFGTAAKAINYVFGSTTTINDLARAMDLMFNPLRANKCQETQVSQHQPCVECEFPYYSLNRFFPHRKLDFELQVGERIANMDTYTYDSTISGQHELYVSTGEDFQVGFFTGLPLMATINSPAPPVAA
nr:MAG: capsid protein [Skomarfal virus 17]